MTTHKEALTLVLKSMKSFQNGTGGLYEGEFKEEIKVCEEALAQPSTINQFHPDYIDEAINEMTLIIQKQAQRIEELEAQLAQPEQEPVAWELGAEVYWGDSPELSDYVRKEGTPLYTTPPQHKEPEQEPKHVATVAEVHMSRYTIEWTNGPLPEGTKLYTTPPQRCPNCDSLERQNAELDLRLAEQDQVPFGFLTNKRQRFNFEPNATGLSNMPMTIDWKIPLYGAPQPQRKPLTFEQRMRICNECGDSVTLAILLTEAAHGIKE